MNDWERRELSLGWLRKRAYDHRDATTVFGWLKAIGVVPEDVVFRRTAKVKLDIDPGRIEAGYLASCAFEWDSWGTSSPVDFVNAIEQETAGSTGREFVAALLTLLGRESLAEAA